MMTEPLIVPHIHEPVYRVVRSGWTHPLDTSAARLRPGRWHSVDSFSVLYTCCSEQVARAVALDVFRMAGVELGDLALPARPQLIEIGWRGEVVDVASAKGVAAADFPPDYPRGVSYSATQAAGQVWHGAGREGVVCRSASLARLGFASWNGVHERWAEVAIFTENAHLEPSILQRRADLDWLQARGTLSEEPEGGDDL